jgi:SAM-dependent methyltransferase/methyltransferase-like protein
MDEAARYDAIPYDSTPFADTHPGHLYALARLHGLTPTLPAQARVLELGCARGGNLIPLAYFYPNAEFLGIELSPRQVAEGQAILNDLALDNIRIEVGDILKLDLNALGQFDYILVHGVYSWVPDAVRSRILQLCQACLSPQGIAYISYNTRPGWGMRGMLRDALVWQTRELDDPAEKLAAAQAFLPAYAAGLKGLETLSATYLRHEIKRLQDSHPSYLFHEYLAEFNRSFLLTEFVTDAETAGLRFVCEAELRHSYPETLGETAEDFLADRSDRVHREQAIDFILNRNFRQALLCRGDLYPLDHPNINALPELAFLGNLQPPQKLDLRRSKAVEFFTEEGERVAVHQPIARAAVAALHAAYPQSLTLETIWDQVADLMQQHNLNVDTNMADSLMAELFSLAVLSHLGLRPNEIIETVPVDLQHDALRVNALARVSQKHGIGHIGTRHHATLELDAFSERVVELLDGTCDYAQTAQQLLNDLQPGGVLHGLNGTERVDSKKLERLVTQNLNSILALLQRHGVLERG